MRSLLLMQIGAAHSMRSPPPCGEGMGVGVARFLSVAPPSSYRITPPHPHPPRKGGGEPHVFRGRFFQIPTPPQNTTPTWWPRPARAPFLEEAGGRVDPVGHRRRPRLQDERRFDLAQEAVAHGG